MVDNLLLQFQGEHECVRSDGSFELGKYFISFHLIAQIRRCRKRFYTFLNLIRFAADGRPHSMSSPPINDLTTDYTIDGDGEAATHQTMEFFEMCSKLIGALSR